MRLIIVFILGLVLAGCARVEYHRTSEEGKVDAVYYKFLTKMEAPEFWVESGETRAGFNAEAIDESASANTLSGAVGDVLRQGGSVSATIPDGRQ
jgi:uncharacterized protein YceK